MIPVIIADNTEPIIQKNEQYMIQAKLSDGSPTPVYKDPYYGRKKEALNPGAGGRVDALLTGAFYKAQYVEVTKTTVKIDSNVDYAERLDDLYGPELQQLSPESKREYGEETVLPILITDIRNIVKL
jgi:hypothetical protein